MLETQHPKSRNVSGDGLSCNPNCGISTGNELILQACSRIFLNAQQPYCQVRLPGAVQCSKIDRTMDLSMA